MSKRKPVEQIRGHRSAAELAVRRGEETHEPGLPPKPQGMDANWRKIWRKWAASLMKRKILSRTDGPALARLVDCELLEDKDGIRAIIQATWINRKPFTDAPPQHEQESVIDSLPDFLRAVGASRASFAQRMQPGVTVCHDAGGEYQWPEGDAAEVARRYALEVQAGTIVAGDLIRRAADRFLRDLEEGASRGYFFDPIAARHVCQFAKTFCGLELMAWQVWVLSNLFGWKKPSGARRFLEAWLACAKKNGKTALASTVGLWGLIADGEKYADIFSAATKKDQSRLIWRDARRAVTDNAQLREHVQRWSGALAVADTDSTFTALSSDQKSMDGLRPHFILADECAFWADREQWDKLTKGVVSRVQPLTFAVTTAGSTRLCFAFGKFDLAAKILRGIYDAPETFVAIYEIDKDDDYKQEACWAKANPSLGVTLRIEHLRKTFEETQQDPSGLSAFLQYHANVWPDVTLMRQGSIPASKWEKCNGLALIGCDNPLDACVKFLELNSDTPMYPGIDIGLTSDLSAVAMLWPRARLTAGGPLVEKKVVIVQAFAPEEGLLQKEKEWQVPLSAWARASWLQLLPGDITDVREIRKYLVNLHSKFRVRECGFDSWQFSVPAAELNEAGILCVAVPQTAKELTPAVRDFLAAVHNGDLIHFGNPLLTWMAGNVVLVESEKHSGIKPEKLAPEQKIDGIAATINSWHRMLAAPAESVYLHKGITFI
jgi:phage terminase large subunit-like protein